jgi:hypothetical protein
MALASGAVPMIAFTAELLKFGGGIASADVDEGVRAELARECGFVLAVRQDRRAKAHPMGVLQTEMAQAPEAVDRHQLSGLGATTAQRPERGVPRAEQRGCLGGDQVLRDAKQCLGPSDHVFGIAAIGGKAGGEGRLAGAELAVATGIAALTVAAVPADSDPLANGPRRCGFTERGDRSHNLMPWYARIGQAGKGSLLGDHVATANAAGLDLDQHFPGARRRNRPIDNFEVAAGEWNLDDLHHGHPSPPAGRRLVARYEALGSCRVP